MRRTLTTRLALVLALATASAAWAEATIIPLPLQTEKEARQISVVVDKGLTSTRSLPTPELRQARKDMLEGKEIPIDLLRQLAEYKDSLAALHYVRLLTEDDMRAHASDIAYFGAIAVAAGRVWALPSMVRALAYLSPETEPKERVAKYIQVLYPHAWAGNTLALNAVIDFNGEGRLFGPLSNATRARIEQQLEALGDGQGELKLAVNILNTKELTESEKAAALAHLRRAAESEYLAVATTAANLIEQLTAETQDQTAVTN